MSKNKNKNKNEDLKLDGLETMETPQAEGNLTKHVVTDATPKFNDIEWLKGNNPIDFINDITKSSKFDAEREPKIQEGLKLLEMIAIDGIKINPLLVLLGSWWEVKPARTAIKSMIDAEAMAKGYGEAQYLQNELGKEVALFTEFQSAIDRVRYAKTYYKPRTPIVEKIITKDISIDSIVYVVPVAELENAKVTFAEDRDAMKKYLISVSKLKEETIVEEL